MKKCFVEEDTRSRLIFHLSWKTAQTEEVKRLRGWIAQEWPFWEIKELADPKELIEVLRFGEADLIVIDSPSLGGDEIASWWQSQGQEVGFFVLQEPALELPWYVGKFESLVAVGSRPLEPLKTLFTLLKLLQKIRENKARRKQEALEEKIAGMESLLKQHWLFFQRSVLLPGLSHQMKTPLSMLLTTLEAAQEILRRNPPLSLRLPRLAPLLLQGEQAVYRMRSLLEQLLKFYVHPKEATGGVQLTQVVRQEHHFFQTDPLYQHQVSACLELQEQLPLCVGSTTEIAVIVDCLLTNALDVFLTFDKKKEPKIALTTGRWEGGGFLQVEDNGPGIPLARREEIFELFFSTKRSVSWQEGGVSPSSGRFGGSGFGLSLCRQIVRSLGGEIVIGESRWGGASFCVRLPFQKQES